ncbi:MAG: hypothetical protein XD81_0113 [Bacteroidetes bacterium 38_7]|nr:MAG: hypothetical protein XD81_0113 [Bacteroidetes bacterium 38_7]
MPGSLSKSWGSRLHEMVAVKKLNIGDNEEWILIIC